MEELKNIIREIKSYDDIKPSDDMILDVSCRIFISQNISRDNKERIQKPIYAPKDTKNAYNESITDKQRKLLERAKKEGAFNGDIEKLTKKEAIAVISALMEKYNNGRQ